MRELSSIQRTLTSSRHHRPMQPVARPDRSEGLSQAELIEAIATRQVGWRDEMVATMVREMHTTVPGYWRLRGTRHDADLRSVITAITDMILAFIIEGRPFSVQEERMLRAIGARRARQGIPAEMLRSATAVASRVAWRYAVQAAMLQEPSPAVTEALGVIGELQSEFWDAAVRILDSGYGTLERAIPQGELFAEIFSGPALDPRPAAVALAERHGHDVSTAHGLVLVTALSAEVDDASEETAAAVNTLLSLLPEAIEVPITSPLTGHATVVIRTTSPSWPRHRYAAQQAVAKHAVLVLLAGPTAGISHLRRAYERASSLLLIAKGIHHTARVLTPADVRMDSLLWAGVDDHECFVDEVLGPLLALPGHQHEPLLDTITMLRTTRMKGGLRATAKSLAVHEKTIAYRFERIRKLTGLDPDVPMERTQLIVAAELLTMLGWHRDVRPERRPGTPAEPHVRVTGVAQHNLAVPASGD